MDRSVGDDDLRVAQPGSSDPFARPGDRCLGDICAKHMTARADMLRQLENCRAGAATNIENALARWGAAKSNSSFVRAATARSIRAYWSVHARVAALFQNSICAAFPVAACWSAIVVPLDYQDRLRPVLAPRHKATAGADPWMHRGR